jgi:hypothetical protein
MYLGCDQPWWIVKYMVPIKLLKWLLFDCQFSLSITLVWVLRILIFLEIFDYWVSIIIARAMDVKGRWRRICLIMGCYKT